MTLFTDGLVIRRDRNLLDDVVTGQLDAGAAAWDQQIFENPITATMRIGELNRAEQGAVVSPAYPAYGIEERRAEPETPLLTAEQARARIKDEGLDLTVEDSGIRAGALDILIERKREEVKRKFILDNAPASTVPIQLLAGFAASAVDPINIASAFIPVVGEARYASMLARTGSSVAARAAVRAQVGAVEGAVGAALVEPLILAASAQDQADYDMTNSLLNVAFGGILGGGLHSAGGLVGDMRRGNLLDEVKVEAPAVEGVAPSARPSAQEFALRIDEDPMLALRDSLERGIAADRVRLAEDAGRQAREALIPDIRAELQEIAAGRLPNVRDLKVEQSALQKSLDTLDDTFKVRAKEFQGQRMSRKQAERAARDAITEERQRLNERKAGIESATDVNRQAEIARGELNALQRGEIPQRYQSRIEAETGRIASAFDLRQTARAKAEAAPWQVRESALRTAIAQAVTGKPIDVESIFNLADPAKRAAALQRIKEPVETVADPEGELAGYAADETGKMLDGTDLPGAQQMLDDELAITQEMAAQVGLDVAPYVRDADVLVADAETYAAAYRAAALCQLRK